MVAAAGSPAQAHRLVTAAAVAATVVLAYLSVLGHGLVFDDLSLIGAEGPVALGNGAIPYRPLRFASLWLDHLLFGGADWGYHLTNILLHAALAVVVHRLALGLGISVLGSALAALLFGLHPLAVESAAYVSGRRDLLAALFGTAGLLAWIGRPSRDRLAVILLLAAVAAKESGLISALVLALASFMGPPARRRSIVSVLVPAGAAGLCLALAYGARGPVLALGADDWLSTSGRLGLHYLSGLAGLRPLAADYPALHLSLVSGTGLLAGLALTVLAAAGLLSVAWHRRFGAVGFVSIWCLVELLILCGLVGMHEPGTDRHAYRLLLPVSLGLVLVLERSGGLRRLGTVALVLFVGLMTARTVERIPVWHDGLSLWSATVVVEPGSARAHYNLAVMLAEAGSMGHAREHLRAALRTAPEYEPARLGLARMACLSGHPRRALRLAGRPICPQVEPGG